MIRSPLPLSQAILNADGSAQLFLDPAKVTPDLPAWLGNGVTLEAPDAPRRRARAASPASACWSTRRPRRPGTSRRWSNAGATVVRGADPTALPRACKNAVEIEGARQAHIRDGAALAQFLRWVATEAAETLPSELDVVAKLEGFREATGALKDLSFDTIAGAASNGAIVHYRPTKRLAKHLETRLAAAGRQRRAVPGRHHRRHPHGRHRHADEGDAPSASRWC